MNKKIKLVFNHDENEFGPGLGISRKKYDEIKDIVWKIINNSCSTHKRTELIETMQDKLGGELTPAEMFSLGISFGVAEYIRNNNDEVGAKMGELLKNIDPGDIGKILNKSSFVDAMKNGKDDF